MKWAVLLLIILSTTSGIAGKVKWAKGYFPLEDIVSFQKELAANHTGRIILKSYGNSFEKNPLYDLSFTSPNPSAKKVVITSGTHGDELIAVEVLRSFISYYYDIFQNNKELRQEIEPHFILVVNPDGYRDQNRYSQDVDPNRDHPYPGYPDRESNPSIVAIEKWVKELQPVGIMDLHAYGRYIAFPWSYKDENISAFDRSQFELLAKQLDPKGIYKIGNMSHLLYHSRGTSSDYYYWKQHIYSFTLEMGSAFAPEESEFQNYRDEVFPSLKAFVENVGKFPALKGTTDLGEPRDTMRFSVGREFSVSLSNANPVKQDPGKSLKEVQDTLEKSLGTKVSIFLDSWKELVKQFARNLIDFSIVNLIEAKNILSTKNNVRIHSIGYEFTDEKNEPVPFHCVLYGHKSYHLMSLNEILQKTIYLPKNLESFCEKFLYGLLNSAKILAPEIVELAKIKKSSAEAMLQINSKADALILANEVSFDGYKNGNPGISSKNLAAIVQSKEVFYGDRFILYRVDMETGYLQKLEKALELKDYTQRTALNVEGFARSNAVLEKNFTSIPESYWK